MPEPGRSNDDELRDRVWRLECLALRVACTGCIVLLVLATLMPMLSVSTHGDEHAINFLGLGRTVQQRVEENHHAFGEASTAVCITLIACIVIAITVVLGLFLRILSGRMFVFGRVLAVVLLIGCAVVGIAAIALSGDMDSVKVGSGPWFYLAGSVLYALIVFSAGARELQTLELPA